MANTAIGIDDETVNPAFKARYTVEAPKTIPNKAPTRMDLIVNSAMFVSGLTNGLNLVCSDIAIEFCYWEDMKKGDE